MVEYDAARARKGQHAVEEKQLQPNQHPGKSDQERMVGNWFIMNDDSKRKGEEWWIGKDEIVMHPNLWGFRIIMHFHRLDASKSPKQIDITVTKTNPEYVGIINGIYAFAYDNQ